MTPEKVLIYVLLCGLLPSGGLLVLASGDTASSSCFISDRTAWMWSKSGNFSFDSQVSVLEKNPKG
jgi:hypothetical protein